MLNLPAALVFVAVTILTWGTYGILLHHGQDAMDHSSLRPFVGVGIAYFLIAVIVPALWLANKGEKGKWSMSGAMLSTFAGAIGALGALGVILALAFKGSPVYVMPLVFGCAPVVNTLVTMWISKTYKNIKPMFIVGLVLVVAGSVGVLINKPVPVPVAKVELSDNGAERTITVKSDSPTLDSPDYLKIFAAIAMAAICWGGYGPFLHLGQMQMGGSRLRPFLCVGIAYFIIAIAVPMFLLTIWQEPGHWDAVGMLWSIAAGAAGAIGALGIIMAFNFGGKPVFVMPLIFGFAPVVNTLTTMAISQSFGRVTTMFIISLAVIIAGAVTVLIFAPKAGTHGKPSGPGTGSGIDPRPSAATSVS